MCHMHSRIQGELGNRAANWSGGDPKEQLPIEPMHWDLISSMLQLFVFEVMPRRARSGDTEEWRHAENLNDSPAASVTYQRWMKHTISYRVRRHLWYMDGWCISRCGPAGRPWRNWNLSVSSKYCAPLSDISNDNWKVWCGLELVKR